MTKDKAYTRPLVCKMWALFGEYVNMNILCLGRYYSVLLLSYPITTTGALESPDLLLLYPTTTLALHITIILIITHKSFNFNHTLN